MHDDERDMGCKWHNCLHQWWSWVVQEMSLLVWTCDAWMAFFSFYILFHHHALEAFTDALRLYFNWVSLRGMVSSTSTPKMERIYQQGDSMSIRPHSKVSEDFLWFFCVFPASKTQQFNPNFNSHHASPELKVTKYFSSLKCWQSCKCYHWKLHLV